MDFKLELEQLEIEIKSALKKKEASLPSSSYFIKDGILSLSSPISLTRKPYSVDGLTLWALQNGKISLNESSFFLIPENIDGENNFLSFFLGIRNDESYIPYSLFDFNKNNLEKGVTRYTVFKDGYVIYILKKNGIRYASRIGLSKDKELLIECNASNNSKSTRSLYSSMYFNPMLMHSNSSSIETKWFKKCEYKQGVYHFETVEDLSRTIHLSNEYNYSFAMDKEAKVDITTSRSIYCGGKNNRLEASSSLIKGEFSSSKLLTVFADTSIAGDIIKFNLKPNEEIEFGYCLSKDINKKELPYIKSCFEYIKDHNNFSSIPPSFKFEFSSKEGKRLSSFMENLIKQVQYCATCKNSTLMMLGVRDIYQAIEAQIIYSPIEAKEKLLDCLGYLDISGRSPRQFAHKENGVDHIRIDSREFIDQGLWIIDAFYQYLAYTGDFDILSKEVPFIKIDGSIAYCLEETSSVYDHLDRIMSYLASNIDEETSCLKTLYGDWNDAIDGLGKCEDDSKFGNGVSSMASFQLYKALNLFKEISSYADSKSSIDIDKTISRLEKGILDNIIIKKNDEYRIVHGWGNNKSFYVGSFNDVDNKNRYALTSNAFYYLSSFASKYPLYSKFALENYSHLEGKYGFLTFNPGFDKDAKEVGRIVNLPIGTAENAATYIHGAIFAIDSLFIANEPVWAMKEIMKVLPINHEFITTTPFVMPNSYSYNKELNLDGDSMNDWFTGSSSTLLKCFVRNIFGFNPKLDHIELNPSSYSPFKESSLGLIYKGKEIRIKHVQDNLGHRCYLNGKLLENNLDTFNRNVNRLEFKDILDTNLIEIFD